MKITSTSNVDRRCLLLAIVSLLFAAVCAYWAFKFYYLSRESALLWSTLEPNIKNLSCSGLNKVALSNLAEGAITQGQWLEGIFGIISTLLILLGGAILYVAYHPKSQHF